MRFITATLLLLGGKPKCSLLSPIWRKNNNLGRLLASGWLAKKSALIKWLNNTKTSSGRNNCSSLSVQIEGILAIETMRLFCFNDVWVLLDWDVCVAAY